MYNPTVVWRMPAAQWYLESVDGIICAAIFYIARPDDDRDGFCICTSPGLFVYVLSIL